MAMALGVSAIYGVISYTVSARHGNGIRLSVRAQRGELFQIAVMKHLSADCQLCCVLLGESFVVVWRKD